MNSLSWFIYIADVVGSFTVFSRFLIGLLLIICLISCLGLLFSDDIPSHQQDDDFKRGIKMFKSWAKTSICAAVALAFFITFIPSKNTMYAIAASQLGESAVKSTLGTKTLQALESWLDSQIDKVKK